MDDEDALLALAALGHPDRLRAFRRLVKAGPEGWPSGGLAALLDIPPTRMSFHLAALKNAGLIDSRRAGQQVRYAIRPETIRALLGFLAEDCCQGRPDLCLPERET